jgi:hypothetical protein
LSYSQKGLKDKKGKQMNAVITGELLLAFATELNQNQALSIVQKLDLMTDLTNAIYVAKQKAGA